ERNANYATVLNYEANVIDFQGNLREAETLYRQAAAIGEQLPGSEAGLARDLSNLAINIEKQARYDDAETLPGSPSALANGVSVWAYCLTGNRRGVGFCCRPRHCGSRRRHPLSLVDVHR